MGSSSASTASSGSSFHGWTRKQQPSSSSSKSSADSHSFIAPPYWADGFDSNIASTSSPPQKKYDVFLSFRGDDTRKTFVGHLYRALQQKTLNTFIDSQELHKGDNIFGLLNAIADSRLSIVVLSENYASSTWCLRELVRIIECMDQQKQIVVPVFYQVDPSDIRKLKGSFGDAMAKFKEISYAKEESLQTYKVWRSALIRIANHSGWDSRKYQDDGKLIEDIVDDVFKLLIHISSKKANGLIGMENHIHEMNLLLCPHADDVRFVAIWGMGGIGKTTIARAVYDEIACQFEHSCFLDNVKEGFSNKGNAKMRNEFISNVLNETLQSTGNFSRAYIMVLERLANRRVLLVLDDVDDIDQIETLLGKQPMFGGGSRIIVTTRDLQSLNGFKYTVYNPKTLSFDEAYELFKQYAFGTVNPSPAYNFLSLRAIKYAQGLPLALKVLGASLHNKSTSLWKDALEKVRKNSQRKVHDVLITSFEGLDDLEKQIFLDVACFFVGVRKEYATKLLDLCGLFPDSGLGVLVDRSLVTISSPYGATLEMHDLLQEMGREMGRASRVWRTEDVYRVFTQNMATESIESIIVNLWKMKEIYFNTEAFVSMTKLRLLKIDYDDNLLDSDVGVSRPVSAFYPGDLCKQQMIGDFKFLSQNLRCLIWHGCPFKSLPHNFYPTELVYLDMRYSQIKQLWEGRKHVKKLKLIDLSQCSNLRETPDLSRATKLEKLNLEGCVSLLKVHPSISTLGNLVFFSLKNCKELQSFPATIHMRSLKILILSGCSKLKKFPWIPNFMMELSELHLDETAIKELPLTISFLHGLVTLNLQDCTEFESLPSSICHLKSLRYIILSGCSKFEVFPHISEDMEGVKELQLDGTSIKDLPPSIERLKRLVLLNMRNCRSLVSLPANICNLAYLRELYLAGCSQLYELPENLGKLLSLRDLEVKGSGIEQLPSSVVSRPNKLRRISYFGCEKMATAFSSWPSSIKVNDYSCLLLLDLSGRNLLELPDDISRFASLRTLKLSRNNFESLPVTLNLLGRLIHLKLEGCKKLKSIPELSSSVCFIDAHDCSALETVSIPKHGCGTNLCFTFSNCFSLTKTHLFNDIVETRSHYQVTHVPTLSVNICHPGSEVPDWFSHQCRGCSVTASLPSNHLYNMFSGFTICAVSDFKCAHYASDLSVKCFCTFRGSNGELSFTFDLLDWNMGTDRFLESDHMFLGYVPWSAEYNSLIRNGEQVDYTEATFRIVVQNGVYSRDFRAPVRYHDIRFCGVRFFYANHEEVQNVSMAKTNSQLPRRDFFRPRVAVSDAKGSLEGYCNDESEPKGDTIYMDLSEQSPSRLALLGEASEGEGETSDMEVREQYPKILEPTLEPKANPSDYNSGHRNSDDDLDVLSSSEYD